jgi:hypothetical protein
LTKMVDKTLKLKYEQHVIYNIIIKLHVALSTFKSSTRALLRERERERESEESSKR